MNDVPTAEVDALFADFEILRQPPDLPADPPSDSWASREVPFRLLAARRTEGRLDVHFTASSPVAEIGLLSAEGVSFKATEVIDDEHAVFSLIETTAWVRLMAILGDGSEIASDAIWVDDETALRVSRPERQILERLHDAIARDHLPSEGYLKILELFDQHVHQPGPRNRPTPRDEGLSSRCDALPGRGRLCRGFRPSHAGQRQWQLPGAIGREIPGPYSYHSSRYCRDGIRRRRGHRRRR